jgi:hypothetical protein
MIQTISFRGRLIHLWIACLCLFWGALFMSTFSWAQDTAGHEPLAVNPPPGVSTAQATTTGPRVYLVTVAPGGDLQSAFGHIGLEVENLPPGLDDSQLEVARSRNIVYEFGAPQLTQLLATNNLALILGSLLNEAVPAGELRRTRRIFERYYERLGRRFTREPLVLNAEQNDSLIALLRSTFSDGVMSYNYRNFTDNCATRIRDLILAVLPSATVNALRAQGPSAGETFQSLASAEINSAIAARATAQGTGTLSVVPQELAQSPYGPMILMGIENLGMPTSLSQSGELFTALANQRLLLADPTSMVHQIASSTNAALPQQLIEALTRYEALLARPPADGIERLFTPALLRQALIRENVIALARE